MKIEVIVAAIFIIFTAQFIYMSSTTDAEYGGADGQAEDVITELTGGTYEPLADPIWVPPSGARERHLFGLQAAFGALVIGYFFGYNKGKNSMDKSE